jgi:RHS repeat-associated protein
VIVAATEYNAYGAVVHSYGTVADHPFGFAGQYTDAESELVYYGLRYYIPKHGRFINRDPIEEAGGNNLFAFVGNGPTNGWDVLGLDAGDETIVLPRIEYTDTRGGWQFINDYQKNNTIAAINADASINPATVQFNLPGPGGTNGNKNGKDGKDTKATSKTEKSKAENDCTRAYDAIVDNTPALPTGGRLDRALQSSGLDVETQLSQAWKESSFNPSASAAPRSSALGMFQILTGTARDVETRVWPNFVSRITPFAPGVAGDWRLDPGVSAQANYVYLLDRVAASGGSLAGGLGLYYGSRSEAANQNYANDVLGGRSVLQDFADKHGGNLREALEQDCGKIKAALSK